MAKGSQARTLVYFLGSASVSVIGFLVSILYSQLFIPSDYAVYSLTFSTYNLIASAYGGWLSLSILRFAEISKKKGTEKQFYSTVLLLHFCMWIFIFIVGNLILLVLNLPQEYTRQFFTLTVLYLFEYYILICNSFLRTNGNATLYSININLNNLLKAIFLVVFYFLFGVRHSLSIILGLLAAEAVQTVYLTVHMHMARYFSHTLFSFDLVKQLFRYGVPLVGTQIATWVLNVSDRYIVAIYCSDTEVGLYSYAYSLGSSLFGLLMQAIMLGAFPDIVRAWEEKGEKAASGEIRRYLRIYFLLTLPACFGVASTAKIIFATVIQNKYFTAWPVFVLVCIGYFFYGLTQYANKAWELTKQTKVLFFFTLLAAVLNVGLNFLLIPKLGYWAAALTTMISYMVSLLLKVLFGRRILRMQMDLKSFLKVFLSSLFMGIAVYLLGNTLGSSIPALFICVAAGALIYGLGLLAFREIQLSEIKKALAMAKAKIFKK